MWKQKVSLLLSAAADALSAARQVPAVNLWKTIKRLQDLEEIANN